MRYNAVIRIHRCQWLHGASLTGLLENEEKAETETSVLMDTSTRSTSMFNPDAGTAETTIKFIQMTNKLEFSTNYLNLQIIDMVDRTQQILSNETHGLSKSGNKLVVQDGLRFDVTY